MTYNELQREAKAAGLSIDEYQLKEIKEEVKRLHKCWTVPYSKLPGGRHFEDKATENMYFKVAWLLLDIVNMKIEQPQE